MKLLSTLASVALFGASALAGSPALSLSDSKKTVIEPAVQPPTLLFRAESSYVFESDFKRGDAKGDAFHNDISLGYRIPLDLHWLDRAGGAWHLRLGGRYNRFEFDNSGHLPLPNTLQSVSGTIALEYIERGRVGIMLETRPGFYFEHDIDGSTFDAPTTLGFAIPIHNTLYGIVGVDASMLRDYPVLPALGFLWTPTPQWTIYACAPEPRITFQANEKLALWAGGQLTGGAFRVDSNSNRPSLNRAVVTYSEYRAGLGLTWSSKNCGLELGGGYAFQRKFDFNRAENGYETDQGAPYLRAEVHCAF
jgi:Domain of unknown function (DUF6268)